MKVEDIIFIILIFCFLICGLFWFQLSQFDKPSTVVGLYRPSSSSPTEKVGMTHASSLLSEKEKDTPVTVELPRGRYVFNLPWQEDSEETVSAPSTKTTTTPNLSTICWNDYFPLAIINGEILTEEDADSESQFRVETITCDKVRIRLISGDEKYVWLTLGSDK